MCGAVGQPDDSGVAVLLYFDGGDPCVLRGHDETGRLNTMPSNKELKLTKPVNFGASQLNSGVLPTMGSAARGSLPGRGHGASVSDAEAPAAPPPSS
jgi:hypothetical protein